MKPKTKRFFIISAIVIAIAVVIWLLFFRKNREFEQVISKLPVSDATKRILRNAVRHMTSSSAWSAEASREAAKKEGYDYAMWVVMCAAAQPEYINTIPSVDYEALCRIITESRTISGLAQNY